MTLTVFRIFLLVLAGLAVAGVAANYKKLVLAAAEARKFYYEILAEMRKVSWPSKDEVIGSTILVGIATLALLLVIGTVDGIFGRIVGKIFTGQ